MQQLLLVGTTFGHADEARGAFARALRLAPGMPAARLGFERLAARESRGSEDDRRMLR